MIHISDLSDEEIEDLKAAIDLLAELFPLEGSRRDKQDWYKWLHTIIEVRAPRVREDIQAEAVNDD